MKALPPLIPTLIVVSFLDPSFVCMWKGQSSYFMSRVKSFFLFLSFYFLRHRRVTRCQADRPISRKLAIDFHFEILGCNILGCCSEMQSTKMSNYLLSQQDFLQLKIRTANSCLPKVVATGIVSLFLLNDFESKLTGSTSLFTFSIIDDHILIGESAHVLQRWPPASIDGAG